MVVVVLVRVIVSSQHDGLVFVVVVRHLFVFERFERAKYIRSKIRNQIKSIFVMLQNLSQMYYSNNNNIKCVD